MKPSSARTLSSLLGTRVPDAIEELPRKQVETLARAFTAAREQQSRELDQALTRALEHVPALMRRPVRKILGL